MKDKNLNSQQVATDVFDQLQKVRVYNYQKGILFVKHDQTIKAFISNEQVSEAQNSIDSIKEMIKFLDRIYIDNVPVIN